jgi:DNA-binding NarL/FixJ family response regulator
MATSNQSRLPRLWLIEPDAKQRRILARKLRRMGGFTLAGLSESWRRPFDEHLITALDCVIMELAQREGGGLIGLEKLLSHGNRPRVIIYTNRLTKEGLRIALERGVQGYVYKGDSITYLRDGIRAVFEGGTYVSASPSGLIRSIAVRPRGKKIAREHEDRLMLELCAGKTVGQAARDLGISSQYAEKLARDLYSRFEVKYRSELKKVAVDLGIVDSGTAQMNKL